MPSRRAHNGASMCRQSATVCLVKSPTRQHRATGPAGRAAGALADPRCRRGKRHPFVAVLLIACSAVVSRGDELRGDRAVGAPTPRRTSWPGSVPAPRPPWPCAIPPSGATIRRVIKDTCPGGLADLLGHDPAGTDTLAVDGKSARGSRLGATPAAHLLAAMTGTGMTVTQLRVPEKTNEITCFAALLDPYRPARSHRDRRCPAHPARPRPLPRRGEEGALRLHREAEPEEPPRAAADPALGGGDGEVLRPHRPATAARRPGSCRP